MILNDIQRQCANFSNITVMTLMYWRNTFWPSNRRSPSYRRLSLNELFDGFARQSRKIDVVGVADTNNSGGNLHTLKADGALSSGPTNSARCSVSLAHLIYSIHLILSIAVDFPLAPLNLYHTGTCLERAFFCAGCSSKAAGVKGSEACFDCLCSAGVTVVNLSNLSFH